MLQSVSFYTNAVTLAASMSVICGSGELGVVCGGNLEGLFRIGQLHFKEGKTDTLKGEQWTRSPEQVISRLLS